MKKIFISCLLALMPLLASAVKVRIDGIWYNLDVDKRTAEVTKSTAPWEPSNGIDYVGDVDIPATVQYEGQTIDVVGIGENAFESNKALTSVTFPNSLTYIETGQTHYIFYLICCYFILCILLQFSRLNIVYVNYILYLC